MNCTVRTWPFLECHMLGLGPAAAQISLGFQHLLCSGGFGSSSLGSERPFHPAPRDTQEQHKKNPLEVSALRSLVEMFLSEHFPLLLLQALLEMEEETLGVEGSQHEMHTSWLSGYECSQSLLGSPSLQPLGEACAVSETPLTRQRVLWCGWSSTSPAHRPFLLSRSPQFSGPEHPQTPQQGRNTSLQVLQHQLSRILRLSPAVPRSSGPHDPK